MEISTPEQLALEELHGQQAILLSWLETIQVTDDTQQKNAEDMLISARYALKEATDKRMELTRPLDESKKRIMALFQPYMDKLQRGINGLNSALHQYHDKKLKEAEAARLTALAVEGARIAAARDTGEIIQPFAKTPTPLPEKTSRAHLGSVTYQDGFDIEIVDPNLVPRDLCEPSMTKIRARVKSGITTIPGILISTKFISVTRTTGGKISTQES